MKYLLAAFLVLTTAGASYGADPAGSWQGAIELPTGELAILVTLKAQDEGAWTGSIDIPAQGLRGFDLAKVSVEGPKVHFEMDGVPGQPTFEGTLSESGKAISGSFHQGPQQLSFSLQRSVAPSAAEPPAPSTKPIPGEGMAGEWMGTLDVGPIQLRLALHAEAKEENGLTATLESVDQNATLPVDTFTFAGGQLNMALKRIGSSFKGIMNKNGSAVVGVWSQGGRELPLTFHRLAAPFALNRPQNPTAPFPYESRDITFPNEAAKITLAGTLVLPTGEGPFPSVVFVTGSGPQDRDESLMGHKPFLVIADHLARHGIASLRFDDRGFGESKGDHMASTVADFSTDVEAGLAFLAQQPEIDRKAIGILGHSEGGLSGPRAATNNDEVDFLVLLAPPGESLRDLVLRQNRDQLVKVGIEESLIQRALASLTEDLALLRDTSLDRERLIERLQEQAEARKKQYTDEERALLKVTPAAVEQGIRQMSTPYFRSLIQEEPAIHLKAIKIPTLVLFGEKDFQVVAELNAKLVKEALTAAENQDYEVRVLPGLNHLFQHAGTGGIEEYGTLEETFAPEALEMISSWIEARFKPSA